MNSFGRKQFYMLKVIEARPLKNRKRNDNFQRRGGVRRHKRRSQNKSDNKPKGGREAHDAYLGGKKIK